MFAARQIAFGKSAKKWENPYITNRIVAMWDGEWNAGGGKHDEQAIQWVDIIGGIGNASIARNFVVFEQRFVSISNKGRLVTPEYNIRRNELTFEFVARRTGGNEWGEIGALFENPWFGINLRSSNNVRFTCNGDYDFTVDTTTFSTYTLVRKLDGGYFYVNGDLVGVSGAISSQSTTNLAFGCWQSQVNDDMDAKGELCAIRMYNYAFSDSEVKRNCEIDQARFGITIQS